MRFFMQGKKLVLHEKLLKAFAHHLYVRFVQQIQIQSP